MVALKLTLIALLAIGFILPTVTGHCKGSSTESSEESSEEQDHGHEKKHHQTQTSVEEEVNQPKRKIKIVTKEAKQKSKPEFTPERKIKIVTKEAKQKSKPEFTPEKKIKIVTKEAKQKSEPEFTPDQGNLNPEPFDPTGFKKCRAQRKAAKGKIVVTKEAKQKSEPEFTVDQGNLNFEFISKLPEGLRRCRAKLQKKLNAQCNHADTHSKPKKHTKLVMETEECEHVVCENVICEGNEMTIGCAKGTTIRITKAEYGRTELESCPATGSHKQSTTCEKDVMGGLRALCNHKPHCKIYVTNDLMGGDPCHDTYKYLIFKYACH